MGLLGERELQRMARTAMAGAAAGQVEVLLSSGTSALTRFANSYIHQNVAETDTSVRVRAVIGKRIGVATTDIVTDAGLKAVAERAVTLARLQQDNEDFISLPGPTRVTPVGAFSQRTADCSPEERAAAVAAICDAAVRRGLVAAGAFRTAQSEVAVANSLGVWAYHRDATADINTVVTSDTASGYAERLTLDVSEIDGEAIAEEAIGRCLRAAEPQHLDPGDYDVILEEYAVADLMDYFAELAFGAQAFLEQRSFMSGRVGERVMGENVSIWDDGLAPAGVPAPFDAEGVSKERVDFVVEGVARDVVWDSYYGSQAGHVSTGHALPAGETSGPLPMNMFMATGAVTKEEMIAATERGILVTRFWYTRPVHPLTVVMTGMTRDGTFLIENGRVVGPVKNLRFTQSYLEAMNQVEMIGRESQLLATFSGTCRVPALKIRDWSFTGATEF